MAVQTGLPGSPGVPVPRAPYQGGPFGTPNVVVPCSASVDGDTITMLPPQGPQWFVAGQLYDQQTFGGIALGTPVGDIQISVARFTLPLYDGDGLANGSIEMGDYFQVSYDSAVGGFRLLNWSRAVGSVTSVGLDAPSDFTVDGSPVTGAGELSLQWTLEPTGTGPVVRAISPTFQQQISFADAATAAQTRENLSVAVYVATRTAMAALDTAKDTVAFLKEPGREGYFQWSPTNLAARVTLDPAQGVYVAGAPDPSGATGAWVRTNQSPLTPYMFGAVGDNVVDDAPALNAFFQYISFVQADASVVGAFAIGAIIYVGNSVTTSLTRQVYWNVTFTTIFTSTAEAVRFRNQNFCTHTGYIGVMCGTSDWTSRRQYDGIVAENCSRTSWDDIYIRGVKRNGFRYEAGAGNLSVVDKVSLQDCGSGLGNTAAGGVTSNCTSHVQTGTTNSVNQREVLTVDSVPPEVAVNDLIQFNGRPYLVTAFDANALTVTVYPWLLNAPASGTVQWFMGAGLFAVGSNASIWEFGVVDARTCAVGFKCHALYPPAIAEMHFGSGGIGISIGTGNSSSSDGGWIGQYYQEGGGPVAFGLVQVTTVAVSLAIGSAATSLFSTWYKLNPNTGTVDGASPLDVNLFNNDGFSYGKTGQAQNSSGSNFNLSTQPLPSRVTTRNANTLTVTLQETADINRLWGYDTMYVLAAGTGARGQPTGIWTFSPEAGYTVNGGASAAFSGFNDPTLFSVTINVTTKDWRVTKLTERLPSVSADKGNAAATLTVAGSESTSIWNTPLTADRAVTLSTTGAANGNRFHIVRTAAATGAFNLNVGTGPLKALAVGQWCDVQFDGTSWVLTGFGSL